MRPADEGTALVLAVLAILSVSSVAAAQERPAETEWAATLGVMTIPGHQLYSGRVGLQTQGLISGGRYSETVELGVGLQAQAFLTTRGLGDVSISAYGATHRSVGFYTGIAREEELTRDLLTLGVDMGWEPFLWSDGRSKLRIPFGPSIVWQSLDLSSGHRDHYADPGSFDDPPDVAWSDRNWVSLGGYGGLGLTLGLTDHFGITIEGTARFLVSDKGSWAGQEEEDIRTSTGNRVNLNYEQPVLFLWTARAGLLWHP